MPHSMDAVWAASIATFLLVNMASCSEWFRCEVCSYISSNPEDGIECLNNTSELPYNNVKCTQYCVTVEHWSKKYRAIESVFRSCSANLGNRCFDDPNFITCRSSCKGNNCNSNVVTTEGKIDELCKKYKCDDSNGAPLKKSCIISILISVLCILLHGL